MPSTLFAKKVGAKGSFGVTFNFSFEHEEEQRVRTKSVITAKSVEIVFFIILFLINYCLIYCFYCRSLKYHVRNGLVRKPLINLLAEFERSAVVLAYLHKKYGIGFLIIVSRSLPAPLSSHLPIVAGE